MKKVIVIIGKSLFARGIFSYLSANLLQAQVCAFDAFGPAAFRKIKELRPDVLILEPGQLWRNPRVRNSIREFQNLVILELRPDSPEINIIKTESWKPANLEEMVSLLRMDEASITTPATLQAA